MAAALEQVSVPLDRQLLTAEPGPILALDVEAGAVPARAEVGQRDA